MVRATLIVNIYIRSEQSKIRILYFFFQIVNFLVNRDTPSRQDGMRDESPSRPVPLAALF